MQKKALGLALAMLTLAGAVFAYRAAFTPERAECPGKITCPLTGDVICADRCPVSADAAAHADVPRCCKISE